MMNKASRKSGGRAWMEPPVKLDDLLRLLNLFGEFVQSPAMEKMLQPGYQEYLRHLGYTNGVPQSEFAVRRVDEFLKSSHLDEEFIVFKMRWLEKVLRLMPEPLALDILRQSPNFAWSGAEEILSLLKNEGRIIFDIEFHEDTVTDFHYCISRFDELVIVRNFLSDLVALWDQHKVKVERFFQTDEFKDKNFQLWKIPDEAHPYIRVGVDSEFKIVFYLNESFRILNEVDITRVRICPRCEQFFWAGRKDAAGCRDCAAALRKKKWRDNQTKEKGF